MREWIRRLSFRAEFAIVFVAAFGFALVGSIHSLWAPERYERPLTNSDLLHTLIFEVVVGSLLWVFLMLRGWTGAQVGLSAVRPWSRKFLTTPLVALGLVAAFSAGAAILMIAIATLKLHVWPTLVSQALGRLTVAPDLRITTVLAVALINPVFEEVFVCGYVISSLRDRIGAANAVTVSSGIRVACHLYQGVFGALVKAPGALIFAIWFARTKRLAPLILAHALMDFASLFFLTAHAGWPLRNGSPAVEYRGDCEVLINFYAAVYKHVDRGAICRKVADVQRPVDNLGRPRTTWNCLDPSCLDQRFYGTYVNMDPNYYTWLVINPVGMLVNGGIPDGPCYSAPRGSVVVIASDQVEPAPGSDQAISVSLAEGELLLSTSGDRVARFKKIDERDLCRKRDSGYLEGAPWLNGFATFYTQAWCGRKASDVAKLFSESGSLAINDGPVAVGRQAVEAAVQSVMTAYPDFVMWLGSLDNEGHRVAWRWLEQKGDRQRFHWTFIGTNTGPGGTGNRVRISGYDDWKIGPDWLITEAKRYYDAQEWDRQVNEHSEPVQPTKERCTNP